MDVKTLLKEKGNRTHTVRPDETIEALLKVLKRHNIGAAVVCARFGEVLGVISERDVIRALAGRGAEVLRWEVHELMSLRTIGCHPDDDLRVAQEKMERYNIRHLPVVEGADLVGMLSMRDVNRASLEEARLESAVLKDFAQVSQTAMGVR